MPLNQRMDNENIVHLHSDNMKFAGKWMELEKENIMCEATKNQKGKHSVYSMHSYVDTRCITKDNQTIIQSSRETR